MKQSKHGPSGGSRGVPTWRRRGGTALSALISAALVSQSLVQAQTPAAASAPAQTQAAAAPSAVFKDEELDQMLAPIALYPDALLAQILMASTYPAQVKEAADWSKAHPDVKGDAGIKAVEGQAWEPAVKSLVAFPQVLAMMREKPGDVQRMGDAFLADPARVMDRVQFLRKKAQDTGNLKSNEQQKVTTQTEANKQVIVIEPAQAETVYVPVYQPSVVYGTWPYPSYPPYYWPPPAYYYPGGAFIGGVIWGAAIVGIANGLWGGCNWGRGDVNINVNRYNNVNVNNRISNNDNSFKHNPEGRRDVPYRDSKSREQYGNRAAADGARDREAYRGKDGAAGRDADRARAEQTLKQRGADPAAGREQLQGADRAKIDSAVREADRSRDAAGGRDGAGASTRDVGGDRGGDRGGASASTRDVGGDRGGATASTRDVGGDRGGAGTSTRDAGAFSGVNNASASRASADRGRSSAQSMQRSAPAGRAGGGARGGGGRR